MTRSATSALGLEVDPPCLRQSSRLSCASASAKFGWRSGAPFRRPDRIERAPRRRRRPGRDALPRGREEGGRPTIQTRLFGAAGESSGRPSKAPHATTPIAKSAWAPQARSLLDAFLAAGFERIVFNEEDAREAGDIRAYLERRGQPIGPFDYLIAAQARQRGAVLVTTNRQEFDRVPGLMVTDWAV